MKKHHLLFFSIFFAVSLAFTACSKMDTPKGGDEPDYDKIQITVGICKSGSTHTYSKKCFLDAGAYKVDCFPEYARTDKLAKEYIDRVDALLSPGSTSSDETGRGDCDDRLIKEALKQGKPVLGICFGCQHINKVLGGKTVSVTSLAPKSTIKHYEKDDKGNSIGLHKEAHRVIIKNNTRLAEIFKGQTSLMVNTSHQNAVDPTQLGKDVVITALADDGIVEGVAAKGCFGVQWHPEYMYGEMGIKEQLKIFETLVHDAKVAKYNREKEEEE